MMKDNYFKHQRDLFKEKSAERSQPQVESQKHSRTNSTYDRNYLDNQIPPGYQREFQAQEIPFSQFKRSNEIRQNLVSPDFAHVQASPQKQTHNFSPHNHDSSGELSLDEGVKASNAHESKLKSPKISSEFKKNPGSIMQKNQDSIPKNIESQQKKSLGLSNRKQGHLNKQQSSAREEKEQDKKGPQALYIGFDDAKSTKDPFSKKPVLKVRAQEKTEIEVQVKGRQSLVNRSKSTNGLPETSKSHKFTQDKSKAQLNIHDKQLRSPINSTPRDIPRALKSKKESPLKKAVEDIKQKENIYSLQKSDYQTEGKEFENEILDPSHNQALLIEIFDNKKRPGKQQEISLADMFKAKKREVINKLDHRGGKTTQDQDMQGHDDDISKDRPTKKTRSKEEILEMRKQMMKSKVQRKQDNFANSASVDASAAGVDNQKTSRKEPPMDLMQRLAMGQKPTVDPKEMKKRTNKNYSNLPEIKKKKEEEQKKLENMARKAAAQEYIKQLNEKRKALLKKKKSIYEDES